MTDDALTPSTTIDEAIERLSKTANDSIDQLSSRVREVTKQRDDLALCLRSVQQAFESGLFVVPIDKMQEGLELLTHCNAIYYNVGVLRHIEAAAAQGAA